MDISKWFLALLKNKKLYQSDKCLLEPADILQSLIQMYLQVLEP